MAETLLYPYVTLNDVKRYIGDDMEKTDKDEVIKWAINKASRLIDGLTCRYYYKKTFTDEYLSTTKGYEGWVIVEKEEGGLIYTPQRAPIIDITELEEDETVLTENTDFYIDKLEGKIEKASGNWHEEPREIKITCNLGYDSADTETPSSDIPLDIQHYALEIAARMSGHFTKAKINYVSGGTENIDIFEIPKWIVDELKGYKPIKIA